MNNIGRPEVMCSRDLLQRAQTRRTQRAPRGTNMMFLALVVMVLLALPAVAQVNTESYRIKPPEDGFTNTLSTDLTLYKGNTNLFSFTSQYRADYKKDKLYSFFIFNFSYGEESDIIYARDGFTHLRGVYTLFPSVRGELFTQWGFDDFLLLNRRYLAGGGGRFTLLDDHDTSASLHYNAFLGVGAMYEYDDEGEDGTTLITKLARSTNYLSLGLAYEKKFVLKIVTYYQPAVTQLDDFRILLDAGITFHLFSGLSMTTSVDWKYDSDPFPGVENYDLELTNGLKLTF